MPSPIVGERIKGVVLTSEEYEVESLVYFEGVDVGLRNHHFRVPLQLL